jgi:tripartite-type tricarboxylate transporter receptor subunit TctC
MGAEVVTSSPEEFEKFIQAEITKWGEVIKQANVSAE